MRVCTICDLSKPDSEFPYAVKGKQKDNAERQRVCRSCRRKQHYWRQESKRYAEEFDAGLRRRNRGEAARWKLTDEELRQVELSNKLMEGPPCWIGELEWQKMCEAV